MTNKDTWTAESNVNTQVKLVEADLKDKVNQLINKNGGWFVMGADVKYKIGTSVDYLDTTAVIIAEATEAEAKVDCEFLGFTLSNSAPYYYKISLD